MCTIILLHRWHPRLPLIAAANRDEFFDRPSLPPSVLSSEPLVIGGRDGVHGGTWLGVSADGLFVALTNQRTHQGPDPSLRSRGCLVLDALRTGSFAGVESHLQRLDPRQFNGFNLLFADRARAAVAYGRPESAHVELEHLRSAPVVLANDRLGSPEFPKTSRAMGLVASLRGSDWPELRDGLQAVLADHELPEPSLVPPPPPGSRLPAQLLHALQALCIHTPAYGTRSATIVAVGHDRVEHYASSSGPPCEGEFVDYTELLRGRSTEPPAT